MSTAKHTKSKPITTSVPSFAIRFHASGEELEELYPSEEEEKSERSASDDKSEKSLEKGAENVAATEINKHESSPMRDYLNKFGKRSSSIDTGINETTLTQQTTSDPWRIFSEFKGKLTKTVEEKLSEIKSKNSEGENSPKLNKDKNKTSSSKENSSVSDSEEQSFSECSIPKSSGLSSTAEDIMSSDDENSLAESEKTPTETVTKDFNPEPCVTKRFRHKIKQSQTNKSFVQFTKDSESDSHVKITSLSTVHEKEGSIAEDDVESGVEACEDLNNAPNIIKPEESDSITLIAPSGFVDLRTYDQKPNYFRSSLLCSIFILFISFFFVVPLPRFIVGFIWGCVLTAVICFIYYKLNIIDIDFENKMKVRRKTLTISDLPILEVPAVKEYQPMTKFEGWMNEYPENYDPRSYHIMQTQSVFLKLEGSVLRISHTRSKIPKRAMWNEPKHRVTFTHHRLYNLKGSQITLLPTGLTHKRLWSKKYPICIILNKEKMNLDINIERRDEEIENDDEKTAKKPSISKDNEIISDSINENIEEPNQTESEPNTPQIFEDEKDIYSDSFSDVILEEDLTTEDWDTLTLDEANVVETKINLFARTCRDKEDWYRRLALATRDSISDLENPDDEIATTTTQLQNDTIDTASTTSNTTAAQETTEQQQTNTCEVTVKRSKTNEHEEDYMRFMTKFNQVQKHELKLHVPTAKYKLFRSRKKKPVNHEEEPEEGEGETNHDNNLWVNSLIARIIYDVRKHNQFLEQFQNLLQKKISTIKLPYFIETIVLNDLSLGSSTPSISNIQSPVFDDRGLWIFMDILYEGITSMAIVTKLNLMKLKEQAGKFEESLGGSVACDVDIERSPIFHSDVEDSAESSDEEQPVWIMQSLNSADGSQTSTPRKPNTGGKKFLQMVDKIASSKYFQQATENKYIKRAMEGVSKTEIKLTVEIQYLAGTLAINIPPPPSDRIWIGFQGNPELKLSALPTFGERSLNFMHVSRWIEKKLAVEFQKFLVLPNMEDFILPVLIPKLPE